VELGSEKREMLNDIIRDAIITATQQTIHNVDFVGNLEDYLFEYNYDTLDEQLLQDWFEEEDVLREIKFTIEDAVVDTFLKYVECPPARLIIKL
jgi:hypothetical protein